jgi:hypothetical protein
MNEQIKASIAAINEAAERACTNIREDAKKAIGDMEARAEALEAIEVDHCRFIGEGDHLFATEIDLKPYTHDIQLGGANVEMHGYRFQIGSGPVTGNSGPELKQGKRYRMIVAFQELATVSEMFAEAAASSWANRSHIPYFDFDNQEARVHAEQREAISERSKAGCAAVDSSMDHCAYCWTVVPKQDLGGPNDAWCAECQSKAQHKQEYTRCKACNAEIYFGNCCNEVCTSEWLKMIRKANTAMSKGRRACRRCGSWHEFKSNHCNKCKLGIGAG